MPTVTSGVIFLIVVPETPAFDKSPTDEYGLPAIIFLAVASPTPGSASSSAAVAVLRSTFSPAAFVVLAPEREEDLPCAEAAGSDAEPLNVTSGAIFLIVAAETPAFDRSAVEE